MSNGNPACSRHRQSIHGSSTKSNRDLGRTSVRRLRHDTPPARRARPPAPRSLSRDSPRTGDRRTELAAAMAGVVGTVPPSGWDFTCDYEVDYGSEEHASVVYKTLVVDKELQPDKVRREMTVSGGKLLVHFEAVEARFLRASFSAFVDLMVLMTKLVEEYGGVSQA